MSLFEIIIKGNVSDKTNAQAVALLCELKFNFELGKYIQYNFYFSNFKMQNIAFAVLALFSKEECFSLCSQGSVEIPLFLSKEELPSL